LTIIASRANLPSLLFPYATPTSGAKWL
jgi:hypothetical protein